MWHCGMLQVGQTVATALVGHESHYHHKWEDSKCQRVGGITQSRGAGGMAKHAGQQGG